MTRRHARLRERLEERLRHLPADPARPVSEWQLVERGHEPEHAAARESVFAVGNGYLGIRGTPEEGGPAHDAGAILNGFHETWPIVYPEDAYGLARTGQTIVSATDGSIIRLFVDGEPFDVATARVLRFERVLDMQTGVLSREVEFETSARPPAARALAPARVARGPPPRRLRLRGRRARRRRPHRPSPPSSSPTAGARAATTRAAARASPRRCSSRSPRTPSSSAPSCTSPRAAAGSRWRAGWTTTSRPPPRSRSRRARAATAPRSSCTPSSRPARRCGCASTSPTTGAPRRPPAICSCAPTARSTARAAPATSGSSARTPAASPTSGAAATSGSTARPTSSRPCASTSSSCCRRRARGEGLGVPAKGVTGHGYEGHYFWDTEVYVLPFLIHTNPEWARQALDFRVGMLGAARRRAQEVGHDGRAVPVADDQRRGGLRVLRRRHRAVPHQRRHRLRDAPVQPRHRRPRVPARPGRRGARRDRALLDAARLLLRAPRRALLHPQRDRARRVHDRRRQQRLHEPHGEGEPRGRHARDRVAPGRRPGRPRGARPRHRAQRGRGRRLAPRRRAHVRPARRAARRRAAGRPLPRAQALGLRRDAAGEAPAAAALPPARALPPPGDQADRRRARHLPRRQALLRGREAAHVRLLRPAHHRRLEPLGLRPERDGVRGRLRRRGVRLLPRRLRGRPARPPRQHRRRHPHRLLRRHLARARGRLRRPARRRRRRPLQPSPPGRVGSPPLPRAGPRPADRGRHDRGRDDLPPARRHRDPDRALRRGAAPAARPAREPRRRGPPAGADVVDLPRAA